MKELLNPQQRSSLRTTLQSFEKNLRQVRSWLDGAEEDGILYKAKLQISEEQRRQVALKVTEALDQIGSISRLFGLEKKEENLSSLIRSELVVSWANLWDARSTKLARYGSVPAELLEQLDPSIVNLAEMALSLSKIFEDLSMITNSDNLND